MFMQYFFHPRMMEVNLVHGHVVYNGGGRLPNDMAREGYVREDDSSSDSSSDSDHDHHHKGRSDREQRRAEKRNRRDEKRAERRERRDERRARKRASRERKRSERDAKNEPWKLILTYRPPM